MRKQCWRLMRRVVSFGFGLLLVFVLVGCSTSSTGTYEPMSVEEEHRYKELYTRMSPGQRTYYEGLPTKAERDAFLRSLGLIKARKRRRR